MGLLPTPASVSPILSKPFSFLVHETWKTSCRMTCLQFVFRTEAVEVVKRCATFHALFLLDKLYVHVFGSKSLY